MTSQAGWRKSSYSDESGTNCVEVAASSVRDSKNPGPVLTFPAKVWTSFLVSVKNRPNG
ncbi:MAG TPA: DUF397 domain-containing protein [Umezawaea sp.]|nr:DUF397 domain-containing protein [Umezawaea sp.]